MSLNGDFSKLEIEPTVRKHRLSGVIPHVTVQGDCSSSSGSSIDEMFEQNNENNSAQNNSVVEDPTSETASLRRSGRKRIRTTSYNSSSFVSGASSKFAKLAINTTLQPLPLDTLGEIDIDNDYLKQIYLDRTIKLKNSALETIFEEPKDAGGGKSKPMIMSGRKFRRFISFDDTVSNMEKKTKKRSMKAKTITNKTRSRSKFNLKKTDLIL